MKKLFFIILLFFFCSALFSQKIIYFDKNIEQEKSQNQEVDFYRHEVRLSYGIETLPNFQENIAIGGFTANYMYRVAKWFWVGANINWQFPTEMEYYMWREYNTDGTFKDFEISARDKFFAVAPELRFSYKNADWVTLYSSFSAGYGIHTGINPLNDYWFWNVTFFGVNFNIGKKHNILAGLEFGAGFKGIYSIHAGYAF